MSKKRFIAAGAIVAIVLVMAVGIVAWPFKKSSQNNHTDASPQTANPSTSSATTQTSQPAASTPAPTPAASSPAASTATTVPKTATPAAAPAPTVTYKYHNGSYTAVGSYSTHAGTQSITVTLTIASDVVTASSVSSGAHDSTSQQYQDDFIAHYQPYVVGKSVDSINVPKVSSSSLTPHGFNAALTTIKGQAS